MVCLSIIPAFHLSAQTPFPTRPPAPARLRPAQFPPFQEAALPNGMTLLLIENHEQPSLSVTLSFRAGTAYDPAGKEGLSAIVAELLTKGTPKGSGGVKSSLLGTTKRSDGTTQVTYNKHPLYRFKGDANKVGATKGEGLDAFGAEWYVVGTNGKKIEKEGS